MRDCLVDGLAGVCLTKDELMNRVIPLKYTSFKRNEDKDYFCRMIGEENWVDQIRNEAANQLARFILDNNLMTMETVETENGMKYKFKLLLWNQPKEEFDDGN